MISIEFLFKELWETSKDKLEWNSILEKAKEMHKQEIMDGFNQGYREGWIDSISGDCTNDQDVETFEDANLYYQETFKTKLWLK